MYIVYLFRIHIDPVSDVFISEKIFIAASVSISSRDPMSTTVHLKMMHTVWAFSNFGMALPTCFNPTLPRAGEATLKNIGKLLTKITFNCSHIHNRQSKKNATKPCAYPMG